MSKFNTVFVYGTLCQGFSNHCYLATSKFLGKGRTKDKFALYVNGIPFVVMREPISQIHGEMYEVDDTTLQTLDSLEGHPSWYKRKEVEIILDDGSHSTVIAWLYFNKDNSGKLVSSGIYSSRLF